MNIRPYRKVKAKIFRISCTPESEGGQAPDLLKVLDAALGSANDGQDPRARPNVQDPNEERLAFYTWECRKSCLFGKVERTGAAPGAERRARDCYFALNSRHLITTLSTQRDIGRLGTHLNDLARSERNGALFSFEPLYGNPRCLSLGKVKRIVVDGKSSILVEDEGGRNLGLSRLVSSLLGRLAPSALGAGIDLGRLFSARLVLDLAGLPAGAGAIAAAEGSGIAFYGSSGEQLSSSGAMAREFEIEKTPRGHLNEQQLQQAFCKALAELN